MGGERMPRKNVRALCEEAFEEHKQISHMMLDLEEWLDRQPPERADSWARDLEERLQPLLDVLGPHFAEEEESTLYREVPVEFPRFDKPLRRLFEEHQKILDDIGEILSCARSLSGPAKDEICKLSLRTQMMITTMKRHESEENEILQQAYWDDLAACD